MDEKIKAKLKEMGLSYSGWEVGDLLTATVNKAKRQMPKIDKATLQNVAFDPEMPFGSRVINACFKTATINRDQDYDYFVADQLTKSVRTLSSGSITQTAVTPLSDNELSFTKRNTDEYYVFLDDWFDSKEDVIARRTILIQEALDRIDEYDAIQLIDAAVDAGNKHTPDSGQTRFRYPNLVDMVKDLENYVSVGMNPASTGIEGNLTLITGSNITTDILKWSFDDDKNVYHTLRMAGIGNWIPLGTQNVSINGTPTAVMDADTAYLVAPDFTVGRESAHFVRRRTRDVGGDQKERLVYVTSGLTQVSTAKKMGWAVIGAQATGGVIVNSKVLSEFNR